MSVRVLVVDDSSLMRKLISNILTEDPEIEVVATAQNGKFALEKIAQFEPDVVTLDVEMPVMDGLETLKEIMRGHPRPVIMISAVTQAGARQTMEALELGAVDFIPKPDAVFSTSIIEMKADIVMKVKAAASIKVHKLDKGREEEVSSVTAKVVEEAPASRGLQTAAVSSTGKVQAAVCIGISTGGPEALRQILPSVPADFPLPILIVQHMPPGFTRAFAERLDTVCPVEVLEAKHGDELKPGRVMIAPGDRHLVVENHVRGFFAGVNQKEKVSLFRPSIDVLMGSVSEHFQAETLAIIMTGMAHDGVNGIKTVKARGGRTLAQDEDTSVVFGMNKLAIETGCVDRVLPLGLIIPHVIQWAKTR
jgi:two-component system chemotaxis response regulator CheB